MAIFNNLFKQVPGRKKYDFSSTVANPNQPTIVAIPRYIIHIEQSGQTRAIENNNKKVATEILHLVYLNMLIDEKEYIEVVFKDLEKKCNEGDAQAINLYGKLCSEGIVLQKDEAAAFAAFTEAHLKGFSPATYNLAVCYLWAKGTDKDTDKAIALFRKASDAKDANFAKANMMLATFYQSGKYVEKDDEKAFNLYVKAASNHELFSQITLVLNYSTHDPNTAQNTVQWAFTDATYSINLDLILAVADALQYGSIGDRIEEEKSMVLRTLAAALGDEESAKWAKGIPSEYLNQWLMYLYSVKMKLGQFEVALRCAQMAADRGDALAYEMIGGMYEMGQGVERDFHKTFQYFKSAYEKGLPAGACSMAICYVNGNGVEQDMQKGFDLFNIAARAGEPLAMKNLAVFYHRGIIVDKDDAKANELIEKARIAYMNAEPKGQ